MEDASILSIIKSKKKLLILVVAFIVVVLLIIIISSIINRPPSLKINNLSVYTKDTPSDTRDTLFESLYNIAKENTSDEIPSSGAMVRNSSFNSTYDGEDKATYVSFIVDIEKIRQSYLVQYEWSKDNSTDNLSSTSVVISCLTKEEDIIYPDFKCKDDFSFDPEVDDPYLYIEQKLPYSFNINDTTFTAVADNDNKSIILFIDTCSSSARTNSIEKFGSWVSSFGINPEQFTITTECN